MPRPVLEEHRIHPAARDAVARYEAELLAEVQAAVAQHPVVVVGMHVNPFVRRAHKLLEAAGIPHAYLRYGGYLSQWRRRSALKMWTGWPTFPMVFVKGVLIGGHEDLRRLADGGELKRLLA